MKWFAFALLFFNAIQSFAQTEGTLKQMDAAEFNRYIREENHGLVVLLPTAKWCAPCLKLHPEYEKAAEDLKEVSITLVQMDYDRNHSFMNELGIESLPNTEIYYNGTLRWRYAGGLPELRLNFEARQALEAALDGSFHIQRYTLLNPVTP